MKNSRKLTGTISKKSLKRISKLMSGGNCKCNSELSSLENAIRDMINELKESNKKLDLLVYGVRTDKQVFESKTANIASERKAESIANLSAEERAEKPPAVPPPGLAATAWRVPDPKFVEKWSALEKRKLNESKAISKAAESDKLRENAKWEEIKSNSSLWEGIRKRADNEAAKQ